jgi:hypothetical protein
MVAACGLPTANFSDEVVNTAFETYRNKNQRALSDLTLAWMMSKAAALALEFAAESSYLDPVTKT